MLDDVSVSKVLVIAPLRVARDTWPAEVDKWDHLVDLDVSVIVGTVKERTAAINRSAMIYVVNRENVKWLIEEETLCRIRGIFSKETDYVEMYRITDYKESQSFFQRMLGVKTVTIYSTDRSDAVTDIVGVSADMDLIGIIRTNVEKCKKDKRIYEITNH
jgi:uncharacterized membrane protein YdbT with pleckstrin-like domain